MRDETRIFSVHSHRGEYMVRRMPIEQALSGGRHASDRLVVDETVRALYPFIGGLSDAVPTFSVVADEKLKSLDGVLPILSWLLDSDFNRGGTLYVVGGGTVQDAASFVASILHRGVPWVYVPTTLLAQGDSCIGGKSSINHGRYKNQLGTFYPPTEVVIDDAFLRTLPPREVCSGIGEMLHYAALGGAAEFGTFEASLADGWERLTTTEMTMLAMRAMAVKRGFIESDEFDTDFRKTLNFGHTFGHGIEFASGGRIPHGIAVAYGIDLANAYAEERGMLSSGTRERILQVVRSVVDGSELELVTGAGVLEGMTKDKKRTADGVELVLIEDLGRPVRAEVPLDERFARFLERHLDRW